jgi:hypothetical protein
VEELQLFHPVFLWSSYYTSNDSKLANTEVPTHGTKSFMNSYGVEIFTVTSKVRPMMHLDIEVEVVNNLLVRLVIVDNQIFDR